jgi:hypothetical protein
VWFGAIDGRPQVAEQSVNGRFLPARAIHDGEGSAFRIVPHSYRLRSNVTQLDSWLECIVIATCLVAELGIAGLCLVRAITHLANLATG